MLKAIQIWDPHRQQAIEDIERQAKNVSGIVVLAPLEASIVIISPEQWDQILDISYNHKIPVTVIISGHENNPNLIKPDYKLANVKVIRWPLYWLTETFIRMGWPIHMDYNKSFGNDITQNETDNFEYTFICMNKRPKLHRLVVLDYLEKFKLLQNNPVTYRELYIQDNYKCNYWEQKILLLDQDIGEQFIQERLPKEYSKSCLQLVTETEDDIFFLTEKTAVPLLFGKPFLVASCKHFHKKLQEFGFELYTEIFDYSFDDIEDLSERIQLLVKNFERYNHLDKQHLKDVYNKVSKKVTYNKNLAMQIACDTSKFPDVWQELAKNFMGHISPVNPYDTKIRLAELCHCKY